SPAPSPLVYRSSFAGIWKPVAIVLTVGAAVAIMLRHAPERPVFDDERWTRTSEDSPLDRGVGEPAERAATGADAAPAARGAAKSGADDPRVAERGSVAPARDADSRAEVGGAAGHGEGDSAALPDTASARRHDDGGEGESAREEDATGGEHRDEVGGHVLT